MIAQKLNTTNKSNENVQYLRENHRTFLREI